VFSVVQWSRGRTSAQQLKPAQQLKAMRRIAV
jgi:hypothetical protein